MCRNSAHFLDVTCDTLARPLKRLRDYLGKLVFARQKPKQDWKQSGASVCTVALTETIMTVA